MPPRASPVFGLLALALAVFGCQGGEGGPDHAATSRAPDGGAPEAAPSSAPAAGPTDEALAEEGEELFQAKGCNACHKLGGGRLVGPDLLGVTERREKAWVMAMIANPDSMLRVDATARQLLSEYYTPMQNMGVSWEQAEALYHYLRHETEEHGGTTS